jgi:plasmid stabilization system protein ParE
VALQLRITLRAAAQIEKANRWWCENRLSAPDALIDDLRAAFNLLLLQPGIGTKVANAKAEGVRRLHLGRVRYYVFYRVKGSELVILAVWHSSRGSAPAL